jgi:hypothetical protein
MDWRKKYSRLKPANRVPIVQDAIKDLSGKYGNSCYQLISLYQDLKNAGEESDDDGTVRDALRAVYPTMERHYASSKPYLLLQQIRQMIEYQLYSEAMTACKPLLAELQKTELPGEEAIDEAANIVTLLLNYVEDLDARKLLDSLPSTTKMVDIVCRQHRFPIPKFIQRKVLFEADHRCAVCRDSRTEIHHIIPWETLPRHEYNDLIALCPTCHAKSDSGEIDKTSLKAYKTKLLSHLTFNLPESIAARFVTAQIVEPTIPVYDVQIQFPELITPRTEARFINSVLRARMVEHLFTIRKQHLLEPFVKESWDYIDDPNFVPTAWVLGGAKKGDKPSKQWMDSWRKRARARHEDERNSYQVGYKVTLLTDHLFSVRFSLYMDERATESMSSAKYWSETANFHMPTAIPLETSMLLDLHNRKCLEKISRLCSDSIFKKRSHRDYSDWVPPEDDDEIREQIEEGAGPRRENFEKFYLTESSIVFIFDNVSPYWNSEFEVAIPYQQISKCLAEKSMLKYMIT